MDWRQAKCLEHPILDSASTWTFSETVDALMSNEKDGMMGEGFSPQLTAVSDKRYLRMTGRNRGFNAFVPTQPSPLSR